MAHTFMCFVNNTHFPYNAIRTRAGAHRVWQHVDKYEEGIDDVHYDKYGRPIPTGLYYAASKGKAKMVRDIIDFLLPDARISGIQYGGHDYTALDVAAENGHAEVIEELWSHDLTKKRLRERLVHKGDGMTAWHRAAMSDKPGHVEAIKALVKTLTDPNVQVDAKDVRTTPNLTATIAELRRPPCAQCLLSHVHSSPIPMYTRRN